MRPRLLGTTHLTREAPADPQSPGAQAPAPAPVGEPPAAPAPVGEPPVEAAPAEPPAPAPAPAPVQPKSDWKDARIAELTAKLNGAKRQLAEKAPPAAPAPTPGESPQDFDARVAEEAARIAAANDWANQCNAVAAAGRTAFPDFDARLTAIKSTINPQDEVEIAAYNSVLETAIETGKAHQLLYDLGANPGEVRRLMGLSPTKRAMELATKAAKIVAPAAAAPEPSAAPAPLTPIGSRGLHYEGIKPDDPTNGTKLPIAQWMAEREKQAIERGLQ